MIEIDDPETGEKLQLDLKAHIPIGGIPYRAWYAERMNKVQLLLMMRDRDIVWTWFKACEAPAKASLFKAIVQDLKANGKSAKDIGKLVNSVYPELPAEYQPAVRW